jgi:hypothetical protein
VRNVSFEEGVFIYSSFAKYPFIHLFIHIISSSKVTSVTCDALIEDGKLLKIFIPILIKPPRWCLHQR